MIVGHHGGELQLVLATIAGAGAVPPLLLLVRARATTVAARLRRRVGQR